MNEDTIRNREDDRHLDEVFPLIVDALIERGLDTSFEQKLPEILAYCDAMKDEPFMDSLMAVREDFALTPTQLERVIRMWVMR